LGNYLDADFTFRETGEMSLAHILVSLNIRGGLHKELNITDRGRTRAQILDYEGIPFHVVIVMHMGIYSKISHNHFEDAPHTLVSTNDEESTAGAFSLTIGLSLHLFYKLTTLNGQTYFEGTTITSGIGFRHRATGFWMVPPSGLGT
jgi:hypothetical protein